MYMLTAIIAEYFISVNIFPESLAEYKQDSPNKPGPLMLGKIMKPTVFNNVPLFMSILMTLCFLTQSELGAQPSAFFPEKERPAQALPIPDQPPAAVPKQVTLEVADPVEQFIRERSLQARIAQLMMVTLEGESRPLLGDVSYLKNYPPGAVLLSRTLNVSTTQGYAQSIRSFESAAGASFLLGANLYEFTQPARNHPSAFIQLPTPMSVLATSNPTVYEDYGTLLSLYAESLGFNFHPGPALDLSPSFRTGRDAVLTLGSDPEKAARIARCFQEAFSASPVIWILVGFPGRGSNREGRTAAALTTSQPNLFEQDGRPYQAVLQDSPGIVHVGNVLVPTLDQHSPPASLSSPVLEGLLRRQLNFQGVIAAGPMDDGLIQAENDPALAAVSAIRAGADMLLWQGNLLQPEKAIKGIEAAVAVGILSEERINASVRRILTLKLESAQAAPSKRASSRKSRVDLKKIGEWSIAVERQAATLIKNHGNALPLVKDGGAPVGITGVVGVEELYKLLEKEVKKLVRQAIMTASHVKDIERFEIERLTRNMRALGTIVVILTDEVRMESQIELLRALKQTGAKVVVLFLGDPREAVRLQEADSIILSYCNSNASHQALQAVAPVLMGKSPLSFREFPRELRVRVGEERTFDATEILRAPAGSLPITLSEHLPAGFALSYDPATAIKSVQWYFDGKRVKKDKAVFAFSEPGLHTVSITVTDVLKGQQSREFSVVAE